MSQPNHHYPAFNYSINEQFPFDSQSSQLNNAGFPQWNQHGSRPMRNIPSPSGTVRTTMTGPNPRSLTRAGVGQSNASHPESRIDPNLPNVSLLSVPHQPRPRSAIGNTNNMDYFNTRLYTGLHDEPWSSERMRTSGSSIAAGRPPYAQTNLHYGQFRGPGSDVESLPRSDSGYYTHPSIISNVSNEPERVDQDLPPSVTYQVGNMNVNSASSESTEVYRMRTSDQTSVYSGRSAGQGKTSHKCPKCKEISKCPSDFKKHMLKHDKPHTCDVSGCRRAAAGKGFTTINDLQRHKKSVHRIGVEKDSYQCASEHCRNRGKIWPRLDNFKQHISRMHKGEDEQDLIRRSVYKEPYTPSVEASVAPMETTLAGIGTGKQFAGSEPDDPVPGMSLTPDQDTSHWSQFDPIPQEFANDVDRTNIGLHSYNSSKPGSTSGLKFSHHSPAPAIEHAPVMRSRQDSLSLLADVASTQASPERPSGPFHRQISNAPQTKAEQQRQALQKLSKAVVGQIRNAPDADEVDLENVVLRVLSGYGVPGQSQDNSISTISPRRQSNSHPAAKGVDADIVMTKAEALKASQAISNIIKQSSSPPFVPRPRRTSKGFPSSNKIQCDQCEATLSRPCDMKKHKKRHSKPYGCTFPKCHKRFGAKSDWKRHENSQHFQLESFLCRQISPISQTPCGELFHRPEMFKTHLQSDHKMTDSSHVQEELRARRIGKNGQGQFYCGFCQKIVPLKSRRNAAWDERFDHIDHHFNKEKKGIEQWYCVEAKKTKGQLLKEMDRTNFDEEDLEEYDVEETEECPPPRPDGNPRVAQVVPTAMPVPIAMQGAPPFSNTSTNSRKRTLATDAAIPNQAPKRRRTKIDLYCCSCQNGPYNSQLLTNCVECDHRFCVHCTTIVGAGMGLDTSMLL